MTFLSNNHWLCKARVELYSGHTPSCCLKWSPKSYPQQALRMQATSDTFRHTDIEKRLTTPSHSSVDLEVSLSMLPT